MPVLRWNGCARTASKSLFEHAIAIDPKFSMAYYFLRIALEQAGDMERSMLNAKQAFVLIDRVSEYERTGITAHH